MDLSTTPYTLATAPHTQLSSFARSLLQPTTSSASSASASPSPACLDDLESALALAVELKLVALASQTSWVPFRNPRKARLDDWVRQLLNGLSAPGSEQAGEEDGARRIAALGGLHRGLRSAGATKALVRDVEVEALVAVEVAMDAAARSWAKGKGRAGDDRPPAVLQAAASLLPTLPPTSVRALNTKHLIELSIASVHPSTSTEDLKHLAAIISSALHALSTDLSSHAQIQVVSRSLAEQLTRLSSSSIVDTEHQTLLLDFVAPVASTMADLVVSQPLPPILARSVSKDLLMALWTWMPIIDEAGGFEAHVDVGRTWWTLVDVFMSKAWTSAERTELVRDLCSAEEGKERTNATLLLAEQLVADLPFESALPLLKNDIVPLCIKHLGDTSHLATFESAHSVILAILSKPLRRRTNDAAPPAVLSFVDGLVRTYFVALMENAEQQHLTLDQLRHAVLILLKRASDLPGPAAADVLSTLRTRATDASSPASQQTFFTLYAAVLPSVPVALLSSYLPSLEHLILTTTNPRTSERDDVVRVVWEGVSGGMGDEGKLIGVEWWLAVRDRLEEEDRGGAAGARAKL